MYKTLRNPILYVVCSSLIPNLLYAADDANNNGNSDSKNLGSITVTGSKLERDLQGIYSSTGVITGENIDDLKLRDIRDALGLQGNVYYTPGNKGNNGIAIRGINSEGIGTTNPNMQPLMTMTIDGAAQSANGIRRGQRGSWDLKQIEVAKGPQSTVQGRNSLAGAITIESRDPTPYWEGAVRLRGSSLGQLEPLDSFAPAAMVSGPISDGISFRIAAESIDGEKDIRYNDPINEFLDDDEYTSVRGKLLIEPGSMDQLAIKLTVSDVFDSPGISVVGDSSNPNFDPFSRFANLEDVTGEKRESDVRNHIIDVQYRLNNLMTLRSVSAYIDTDLQISANGSAGGSSFFRDTQVVDSDITQEFILEYGGSGSNLSGIAGLFYGKFSNESDNFVRLGDTSNNDDFVNQFTDRDSENIAVYADGRYRFNNTWSITAGARYTVDKIDTFVDDFADKIQSDSAYTGDAFLPQGGVIYTINDTASIAFTVTRGYRSGFAEENSDPNKQPGDPQTREIKPEFLTSYDLAWRSMLFDSTLRFNTNLYYYDWRDQQIALTNNNLLGLPFTENAGKSRAIGAEIELGWQPDDGSIDLGMSLGLQRTELVDFVTSTGSDFSGKEFPEAPRISGGLWVNWRFGEAMFISSSVSARGGAFTTADLTNRASQRIPGYAVVDLNFGYEQDEWAMYLAIDNLLDRGYIIGTDVFDNVYVGDPITYTAELFVYF